MDQPVPGVTAADVERIARRDFPARASEALAILAEYGPERWHNEPERVRIAALKLANGNLKRLRQTIETAKCDYRDVLAPAEYPNYERFVPGPGTGPSAEVQRIIDADWQQFQEWFNRS
jgi:hypothetical protein